MSEVFADKGKEEQLKQIIKRLHAGSTVQELKKEFADLLEDLSLRRSLPWNNLW